MSREETTRRRFLAGAAASVIGTRIDSTKFDSSQAEFAPTVAFECYAVEVEEDEYDRVTLQTDDGATFEFTDGYNGTVRFGYAGDGSVDEPIDAAEFRGPIRTVTVERGRASQTVTRDDSLHCEWGADDISFDRSTVETPGLADGIVTFADGTTKHYEYGVKPGAIGSPGRVVESVESIDPPATVYNPAPAEQTEKSPATYIDCTKLVVGREEFVAPKWDDSIADATFTGAKLEFADGSTQTFGSEPKLSQTPYEGEFTAPATFEGTDEHAGKKIRNATVYGINPVFYLELTNDGNC